MSLDAQLLPLLLFLPLALFFLLRLLLYTLQQRRGKEVPVDQEMLARGETLLLGRSMRQVFASTLAPLVRFLAGLGISPNSLTVLCFLLSLAAGALIGAGWITAGGVLGLLGSALDYLDGRLARSSGRASQAGAFLDSTLDRYSDMALLGGAAVLYRDSVPMLVVCLVAMGSAVAVSYTRAKAESLGAELKVGLMQRPERIVLFAAGAILGPPLDSLLPVAMQGRQGIFAAALLVLAALSLITAMHRTVAGFRALR